jgi:SAM-dependent methyltransferase
MRSTQAEQRVRAQEAVFHDTRARGSKQKRLGYAYASVADVYEATRVPPEFSGRSILEVGCFCGDDAAALRDFTGRYTGVDISPAAIEECRRRDLPANFRFLVDDANVLGAVEDGSVDYAFGNGVLHHLDLASFSAALARKLAPGGLARFVEPARGNLLVRAFRWATPRLRTPDERPFDDASFRELARRFDVVVGYHALLRPFVPMLFMNSPAVIRAARWADERLLRRGMFQRQAWLLCIELRALAEPAGAVAPAAERSTG